MHQPSPAEITQRLLTEETELLVAKARHTEQGKQIDDRLAAVRSVIEGLRIGRELAQQEAATAATLAAEAVTPSTPPQE